jgi:hypothetical protein
VHCDGRELLKKAARKGFNGCIQATWRASSVAIGPATGGPGLMEWTRGTGTADGREDRSDRRAGPSDKEERKCRKENVTAPGPSCLQPSRE